MSRMHANATSVSKRNHCQKPFPLLIRFLVICLCISYSSAWRSPAARNAVPPALINIRRGCAALLFGSYLLPTSSVFAAADVPSTNGKTTSSIIYKSGKNPRPADPSNPKAGTRKDSTFLKCLSSCKQDCQKPSASLAKGDCVQDCQDQCCATYEQCSFKVKTAQQGGDI